MDAVEQRIIELIDGQRQRIIDFANKVYSHPELGYKEFLTSEQFSSGIAPLTEKLEKDLAITGVKGYLKKNSEGPILAIIGELDAVVSPKHPAADPTTGAAHACGHHAQLAGVFGAALALSDEKIKQSLDGNVAFIATPAEEYGEIAFKETLRAQGKISFGGGKCEMIKIGVFDDIDAAVVHHAICSDTNIRIGSNSNNGFVSMLLEYTGREAHAGAAPHMGVNALNAAVLGMDALGLARETFQDADSVRVHPIITKGGDIVNVVPGQVNIETLVRAKSIEAIMDAAKKTRRSFAAGAYGVGATLKITTAPGYLPVVPHECPEFMDELAHEIAPGGEIERVPLGSHATSSTDVGDLTHIMPVLKFTTGGFEGATHSDTFKVVDEEKAYVATAKMMALTAYRLLRNSAAEMHQLTEKIKPILTKEEYLKYMDTQSGVEIKDFMEK